MAKVTPIAVISRMSGKVNQQSDMYFATNRQTGRVYTGTITESGKSPSPAQLEQRAKFASTCQLVSAWFADNKPSDSHPNGTDVYQRTLSSFRAQHTCGSFRAYVFVRIQPDGTLPNE